MISKRGRKILRTILYKISLIVVCKNQEIKLLYKYLITRKENPLKKKTSTNSNIRENGKDNVQFNKKRGGL